MRKKILTNFSFFIATYMILGIICCICGFFGKKYIKNEANTENSNDSQTEIRLKRSDEVTTLTLENYLYGVVAAEMPATFETEALKAQAVAARTYTKKKKQENNDVHLEADVCDDINHCKAYISEKELREKYGENWISEYYPKIKNAVRETDGIIATYEGKPITAVFHSTSSGMTENSGDVWSKELPYLVSVVSEGEKESPRYTDKIILTLDDFKNKLYKSGKNLKFSENKDEWIGEITKNKSGSINKITVGGIEFKGTEIRSLLGLRSTNFTIKLSDKAEIETTGNGHGVGMSQYGANYMAKQGYNYEQILKKYYTGITVEKRN